MSEIKIRPAHADELGQIGLLTAYVYAGNHGEGENNIASQSLVPEWTLCAFDGATLVTSFATYPFTMRANGRALSFGGVTAVGTLPEYRRRGIVRRIMTQATAQQREAGQCVAGLWASQAAIYQRYGYAAAGMNRNYQVDTADIRFADGDAGTYRVKRLAVTEAMDPAKSVYREFAADRFGYLHRSQALWRNNTFEETAASGPVSTAVAMDGETIRGYVAYTLRGDKVEHAARSQEIVIRDFAWLDIDAYRTLWSFLGAHDLVGRVTWNNAPMDDPAVELFAEPRMLHCCDREGSWMRIVDAESALAGRGYQGAGSVVIEVVGDDLAPWNNGRWHLEADAEEARCRRTEASADVTLSSKTLSSLFTGMRTASQLSAWGLLEADRAAVAALDGLFAQTYAPHCPDHY